MRKIAVAGVALLAVLSLTACKEVDKDVVHATKVRGTDNLYSFCDERGTLIYFTDIDGGDDEYEAFWLGGCDSTGQPKPGQGSETTGGDQNDR